MKDRKKYFLREAVVLLIALAMVLTAIPAVTADDTNTNFEGSTMFSNGGTTGGGSKYDTCRPLPRQTSGMGGFGDPDTITYNDGSTESHLGLTGAGFITMAIELTDVELASYRAYDITELWVSVGSSNPPEGYVCNYEVWIQDTLPADPYGVVNVVATGTSTIDVWQTIDVTDYPIPDTGSVYIGINFPTTGTNFPCGIDEDNTAPMPRAGIVTYDGGSGFTGWTDLVAIGFPGVWGLDVIVESAGPGPVGDCLPDQCDFELVSINNLGGGIINSLPQIINITITNNGEVGIAELKLLADVYEKVCGPTTTICEDTVYDLCDWEDQAAADWTWIDDGDGDTFVLQGGPDNRWLTNDQAWRCTMGEDRSFGGDEDVYLGLSPGAVGFDELIWHCADSNDLSGAACAEFTFNHWCEGEYFYDHNGDLKPVDYGTLAYSLDDGATWTNISIADFVAFDTEDEWQEITIKFINLAVYEAGGYYEVCDDCEPEEDDILIEEEFPDVAKLQIKFIWHKDPCLQFEGWYIDDLSLTRTEMYELILVHQTHDIIELPPCDPEVGPQNIYYEFPLGFDPEPDTWYQICIIGQVFDCPDCCEQIFDNNEMCLQFFVTDIHDMACVGNEILDPQDWWTAGDTICVNATVKNMGTFAESNVPVELKVGNQIVDRAIDQSFESDTLDDWDYYYFTGSSPEVYFRWTKGDATIDGIGDGRSILPGSESVICAEQGYYYPYLPNGAGCGMAWPDTFDLSDVVAADLNFYAKWSIPANQDCDGDGYIDSFWGVLVHPTSGPDSAYWWFADSTAYYGWENDWQFMTYDLKAEAESFAYDGTIPDIELLFGAFMCTEDGNTIPPDNPIGWSGLMIDNVQFDIKSCGTMEVVDTAYTGSLAPGATETLVLCWDEAEFSNWCFAKDVQLPGDIDPDNDICWDNDIKVRDSLDLNDWSSWDLTAGDDEPCLWHICCTRTCDGSCCAWAGIEEDTSGHYVPDMNDNMISPMIPIDVTEYPLGISLNITTWYDFCEDEGDFGEVYVRNSTSGMWFKLGKVTGNSSGFFEELSFYIEPWMFTDQIQIRFRMRSDGDDIVCEGWYVCHVKLVEVLDVGIPPASNPLWYACGTGYTWPTPGPGYMNEYDAPSYTNLAPETTDDFIAGADWYQNGWLGISYAGTVYDIDEFTGDQVFRSSTSLSGCSGLTVHQGTVYACTAYDLYELDPDTGATIHKGPFGTSVMISIASDDTNIYGIDIGTDSSYIINPNTGAAALLGSCGQPMGYAQDSAADKDTGEIFHAAYQSGGVNRLCELNKVTGALDLINMFPLVEIVGFAIPSAGEQPIEWGELVWEDEFNRETIAPWQCITLSGGDYWDTDAQCISGYTLEMPVNNAMYTMIDLTDPELYYAELYFTTEWDIEDGTNIFIEISPDWDGIEPMQDATWVAYWSEEGASAQALISSEELVEDDRFIINEFLGETIYLRFRLETSGEGKGVSEGFWCIHDKSLIIKIGDGPEPEEDNEPPVTNAYFDCDTAKVTLVAVDYPTDRPNCGVKATYYRIDSGSELMYTAPFTVPEGTHTISFYSVDNCDNTESTKTKTYTVDTTPPTVQITSPEEGKLYLFGSPIMNRILSDVTLCIGKVPIAATADDAGGSGVNKVLFGFDGGTSWDESAPYEAEFRGMKFGDLAITVTAIDNVGLESAPDTMTVKVYCLGLF
jgi:hypothetical protein